MVVFAVIPDTIWIYDLRNPARGFLNLVSGQVTKSTSVYLGKPDPIVRRQVISLRVSRSMILVEYSSLFDHTVVELEVWLCRNQEWVRWKPVGEERLVSADPINRRLVVRDDGGVYIQQTHTDAQSHTVYPFRMDPMRYWKIDSTSLLASNDNLVWTRFDFDFVERKTKKQRIC
jgi:hypothetical protein